MRGGAARWLGRAWLALLWAALMAAVAAPAPAQSVEVMRGWIEAMKDDPRGPFEGIRWYCADGTVHPAQPYPCEPRGGGIQHGSWSPRTRQIRAAGYLVGNVLAAIDPREFLAAGDMDFQLAQIILERFLIRADDGWILRKALYYRGAFQIEDEEAAGRQVLLGLCGRPQWRDERFLLLREAVRALPHGYRDAPMTEARQLSKDIGDRDPGFQPLRSKLHANPGPEDVEAVRQYAAARGKAAQAEAFRKLNDALEQLWVRRDLPAELKALAQRAENRELADLLRGHSQALAKGRAGRRMEQSCQALSLIRANLELFGPPENVLQALDTSLSLEQEVFMAGTEYGAAARQGASTRRELVSMQEQLAGGLYGLGLLSERELGEVRQAVRRLADPSPRLGDYKAELDYLGRVSEWAERKAHLSFGQAIDHFANLEPKVRRFPADRLRGSPLLHYADLLELLGRDAGRQLGSASEVFGRSVSFGLSPLNPGLARGRLYAHRAGEGLDAIDPAGIHLLPETVEDLKPVRGILTEGQGNSLSHVQLLAGNLGIPNVAVDRALLPDILAMAGRPAVLAVSPRGVVRLAEDGPEWDRIFAREAGPVSFLIPADQGRLRLDRRELIPLEQMGADDVGRVAGAKAANLGELKKAFPEAVTEGLVLPFGIFAGVLERPFEQGLTARQWLARQYQRVKAMGDSPARPTQERQFLSRFRSWLEGQDLGAELRRLLAAEMQRRFGPDGSYGVYVRSDTNVEDLPGFTGAGLNLTIENVAGFDNVAKAIARVWASPFTERAYGWRQANMEKPDELFVSVLLLKTVPSDKSGVLITADIHGGQPGKLSVAVSEGVGGAVAGQRAEELLIDAASGGEVRLINQAAEPLRRVPLPQGGLAKVPAGGADRLLSDAEIDQLRALAASAPGRFARLRDVQGKAIPADMEFGFVDGRLWLFQIRAYQASEKARRNDYLLSLDSGLAAAGQQRVDMQRPPKEGL